MKFLFSSLLLASFCTLSSWSVSSGTPVLDQIPQVSAMEGENVNITCCWRGELERGTFEWWKKQIRIKSELFDRTVAQESGCSYLILSNVTKANSGRYICQLSVEIPHTDKKVNGNGTELTVTDRENAHNGSDNSGKKSENLPSSSVPLSVIIPLGVVAPLLLISLLCFCTLKWRKAKAAMVIYEVPHIDSEEAEMDKHSTTSSRGSTQWCEVPVYEYFERVQDKESG